MSLNSVKYGGVRCSNTKFNVKRGREGGRERLLGKSISFCGAAKGHLTEAVQNSNELGRRKRSLSVSHLDISYLE